MLTKWSLEKREFYCIVVYMSTNDIERNRLLKSEIEEIISSYDEMKLFSQNFSEFIRINMTLMKKVNL